MKPLDDTISKNKLHLFSTPKKRKKTKAQEMMAEIKSDRNLFSRLYVACQVRDGNLEEFFSHENQSCPPSLSDRGKLRLGKKSDIIHCLEDEVDTEDTNPVSDVVVLDGAAIVNMLKPGSAKTFGEIRHIERTNSRKERQRSSSACGTTECCPSKLGRVFEAV